MRALQGLHITGAKMSFSRVGGLVNLEEVAGKELNKKKKEAPLYTLIPRQAPHQHQHRDLSEEDGAEGPEGGEGVCLLAKESDSQGPKEGARLHPHQQLEGQ